MKQASRSGHNRTRNGHDPKAFILSSNIARRHMTAGQRAMAYARIYPADHFICA
jgi:hypothetical protein